MARPRLPLWQSRGPRRNLLVDKSHFLYYIDISDGAACLQHRPARMGGKLTSHFRVSLDLQLRPGQETDELRSKGRNFPNLERI